MTENYKAGRDSLRAKAAELYSKYGYFLPRRKVVAATLGTVVAYLANEVLGVVVDPTVAATIGAAVFGYLVPENPDVSLAVVLQDATGETTLPNTGFGVGSSDKALDFRPDQPVDPPVHEDDGLL